MRNGFKTLSYELVSNALISAGRYDDGEAKNFLKGYRETIWSEILPVDDDMIDRALRARLKSSSRVKEFFVHVAALRMAERGGITPTQFALHLGLTIPKASTILTELKRRGKLKCVSCRGMRIYTPRNGNGHN